jgi:hypothetical protein
MSEWSCSCQGCDKARKAEREHILKLLERTCDCDKSNPVVIIHKCLNRFALAEIKGETK